jgi:hypothetical protein
VRLVAADRDEPDVALRGGRAGSEQGQGRSPSRFNCTEITGAMGNS